MSATAAATFIDTASGAPLQELLVATPDLGLTVKQAHWKAVGRAFRPIQLRLDEIRRLPLSVRDHADESPRA
jgi:DNA-binding ferritin-like protein